MRHALQGSGFYIIKISAALNAANAANYDSDG